MPLDRHAGGMRFNIVPPSTFTSDSDSLYTDTSSPLWSSSSLASTDASSFSSAENVHGKLPTHSVSTGHSRLANGTGSHLTQSQQRAVAVNDGKKRGISPPQPAPAPHQYRDGSAPRYPTGYVRDHVDNWTSRVNNTASGVPDEKRAGQTRHARVEEYDSDKDGFDENGERVIDGSSSESSYGYPRHDQYLGPKQFQNGMYPQNRNPAPRHTHVRFLEEPMPTNFNRQPTVKQRNDLRVTSEHIPHAQPSSAHLYPYNGMEDELSRRLDDVLDPASRGDSRNSSPRSYRDKPEMRTQSVYVDTSPNDHLYQANMQSYNANTHTNTQAAGHANSQHLHHVNMQYSQQTGAHAPHSKDSLWPSPSMSVNRSLSGDSSSSYETRQNLHYHPSHSTPHYPSHYTSLPTANSQPLKQYKVWVPPSQTAENVQPVKPKRKVIKPPMSKASDAAAKLEQPKISNA